MWLQEANYCLGQQWGIFFQKFLQFSWIMQSLRTTESLLSWSDSLWDTCQKKLGTWKLRVRNQFLPENYEDVYSLAKPFFEGISFEICHHQTSSPAKKQTKQTTRKHFSPQLYIVSTSCLTYSLLFSSVIILYYQKFPSEATSAFWQQYSQGDREWEKGRAIIWYGYKL